MTLPLTPETMAAQVRELHGLLVGVNDPILAVAIQELGLNIRTAYIRYGERLHPAPEPVTNTLRDEGGANSKTASTAPSEPVCCCVKTGAVSDTTHCPVHRTNPAPGGVAAPLEASVEDLKPFMMRDWYFPTPMWEVWKRFDMPGSWGEFTPAQRLETLAKLTPQQRGQLLKAVKP